MRFGSAAPTGGFAIANHECNRLIQGDSVVMSLILTASSEGLIKTENRKNLRFQIGGYDVMD